MIYPTSLSNKQVAVRSRQAPWMTQSIKNFIRKKNRAFNKFIKNRYPQGRQETIEKMVF